VCLVAELEVLAGRVSANREQTHALDATELARLASSAAEANATLQQHVAVSSQPTAGSGATQHRHLTDAERLQLLAEMDAPE
jgi:hypothetical protein